MRIIGGKLGGKPASGKRENSREEKKSSFSGVQIWDDFVPKKKGKAKQVFSKTEGDKFLRDKGEEAQEPAEKEGENQEEIQQEFQKPREDYKALEEKLGYVFKDRELFNSGPYPSFCA